MEKNNQTPPAPQGPEESHGLLNFLKLLFLIGVLAGAWYLLDGLINGK